MAEKSLKLLSSEPAEAEHERDEGPDRYKDWQHGRAEERLRFRILYNWLQQQALPVLLCVWISYTRSTWLPSCWSWLLGARISTRRTRFHNICRFVNWSKRQYQVVLQQSEHLKITCFVKFRPWDRPQLHPPQQLIVIWSELQQSESNFLSNVNLEIVRNFILLRLNWQWSQLGEVFQCALNGGQFDNWMVDNMKIEWWTI